MFKRLVNAVEMLALLAAAAFVVLLFVNRPASPSSTRVQATRPADAGAAVFASHCAGCHGSTGQGGIGPKLAGRVTADFPNVADQVAFVKQGRGSMPAWQGRISAAEIDAVVAYTRALAGD